MNNKEVAKNIIDEILSSPEFQPEKKVDPKTFDKLRKLVQWIYEKILEFMEKILEKLFGRIKWFRIGNKLTGLSNTGKIIVYIVVFAIIGLLSYLLVRLILKIIRNASFRDKKLDISDELEEFTKAPSEPLRLALEYKEKQDYRLSFRYFFLAILIDFNEREFIRIQKFKTNRHYINELYGSNREIAEEAAPFFNAFYYIWYGKRSIDLESLLEWENKYYSLTSVKEEGEDNAAES